MKGLRKLAVLVLTAAQLAGSVSPAFCARACPSGEQDGVTVQEIGGIAGLLTVVRSNLTESIHLLIDTGSLMQRVAGQNTPPAEKKPARTFDRIFTGALAGLTPELRLESFSSAAPPHPESIPAGLFFYTLLLLLMHCFYRLKLSRWRSALARGSIDDAAFVHVMCRKRPRP